MASDTPMPPQSLPICSRQSVDVGFRACGSRMSRSDCSAGLGSELQRHAVDAIAQMCRRRSVIEDVSEMASAAAAVDLVTDHPVAAVCLVLDRARQRIVEARPAGSAFELHLGNKQRLIAGCATEGAGALLI